jgi:polysaccharide deacetylase family protein (PEP-CTERM system associated)
MVNILTVDVEEWYHGNLADGRRPATDGPSRLERNVAELLALFAAHEARATFFVVGSVAERKPAVVEMIRDAGHDIAIHGHDHRLVYQLTPAQFERDTWRALDAVQAVTGKRARGYRAPSWSISSHMLWAYEVLGELGLEYDASVCPFRTFLYGDARAPRFPCYPARGRGFDILEIPLSTVRVLGRNVPFSGGFYLRMLPWPAIALGVRRVNAEGHPAIVYVHPHDIDADERRLPLGLGARFIQYAGVSTVRGKLERLLARWRFTSIETALDAGLLRP